MQLNESSSPGVPNMKGGGAAGGCGAAGCCGATGGGGGWAAVGRRTRSAGLRGRGAPS